MDAKIIQISDLEWFPPSMKPKQDTKGFMICSLLDEKGGPDIDLLTPMCYIHKEVNSVNGRKVPQGWYIPNLRDIPTSPGDLLYLNFIGDASLGQWTVLSDLDMHNNLRDFAGMILAAREMGIRTFADPDILEKIRDTGRS